MIETKKQLGICENCKTVCVGLIINNFASNSFMNHDQDRPRIFNLRRKSDNITIA